MCDVLLPDKNLACQTVQHCHAISEYPPTVNRFQLPQTATYVNLTSRICFLCYSRHGRSRSSLIYLIWSCYVKLFWSLFSLLICEVTLSFFFIFDRDGKEVAVTYFRSGYSPDDYPDENVSQTVALWLFSLELSVFCITLRNTCKNFVKSALNSTNSMGAQ